MQNQRTEAKKLDDLPLLSAQEERLIEAHVEGLDQVSAYRAAYGAEGYGLPALKVRACRKFSEPKIQQHLRALRAAGHANLLLSAEGRIQEEYAFAQRCEDVGNMGAAGGTFDRINKLKGLYVEKLDIVTSDPRDLLKQIAEISPELAGKLAEENNIIIDVATKETIQ